MEENTPGQTQTIESPGNPGTSTTTTENPGQSTTQSSPDDFNVDESILATLTPESRVAVEPILKSAKEKLEKIKESSKSYSEKAQAFDTLVKDQRFIQWYKEITNPQLKVQQNETSKDQEITEDMLQDVSNDPVKYAQLLEKKMDQKYAAKMAQIETGHIQLKLQTEFDSLTRAHPDLWDLDKAGLFEPFLYYYTDLNKRPMAEAYANAKKVGDFFAKKAKDEALGLVNNRKASVTESGSTSKSDSNGVVYAKNSDEAMRMQIEEFMPGGLKRQVVVKK